MGSFDRCRVEVDAVDVNLRVSTCDCDARNPTTTGEVRHPGGRIGQESRVNLGHRRQPLLSEQPQEERSRERRLALVEVRTVVSIGNATPASIRLEKRVDGS